MNLTPRIRIAIGAAFAVVLIGLIAFVATRGSGNPVAGDAARPSTSNSAGADAGAGADANPEDAAGDAAGDPSDDAAKADGSAGGATDGKSDGKSGGTSGGKSSGKGDTGSGPDSDRATGDVTAPSAATDPNSPFVVAASAIATRSRDQVLLLHAMSVSTTSKASEFPKEQIPGLGANVVKELERQVKDATMAIPPKGSAAAKLVSALDSYKELAGTVADWDSEAAKPLSKKFFNDLAETDKAWKEALGDLSDLSGKDLLANLPPLAMPA